MAGREPTAELDARYGDADMPTSWADALRRFEQAQVYWVVTVRTEGGPHLTPLFGVELDGALYRIGPNPHFPPMGRYHWFDGDGMIHAFIVRDGRASYRNRYVKTDGLRAEMKAGKALFGGLIDPTR